MSFRSISIRSMMFKVMSITFVATVAVLSVLLYFQARSYAIQEAERKIKNLLLEHQALHTYISKHQKPAISKIKEQGKLDKDYFSPEILSSSYITKYMHQYYNEQRKKNDLSDFYYKLAANNPRNPENRSDQFEQELITKFNSTGIKEYKEVVSKDGNQFLYYALPFTTNSQDCMACHSTPAVAPKELLERYGDKNGFGEKVGEIRAIISIRAPLEQEITQANNTFRKIGILMFGIFLALFSVGGWVLMRSVTKPINSAVLGLSDAAQQVAAVTMQVSSNSQELAEGASIQAASIEETSSSLEEMASMTRQNAENASRANQLMSEANTVVGNANESMTGLTASMGEISKSSENTQKIIKTIDEIAFQTNLLALNAAVEAARAGEAGAGFAVVADEVRTLAMRAADAAKNTASLIEGTVKTIKEGSTLVDNTNREFRKVAEIVTTSGAMIREIAAASHEQAQGIDQISKAIVEMESITQRNNSTAEESASASEQMKAQAVQMKEFVTTLSTLVGGVGNGGEEGRKHSDHNPGDRPPKTVYEDNRGNGVSKSEPVRRIASRPAPGEIIPLQRDDLRDF